MKIAIKEIVERLNKPLLISTIIFFLFGLLCITTASSREAVATYEYSTYHYFFRQVIMLVIGLFLGIFILTVKTKRYKIFIPIIYFVVLLLSLLIFFMGNDANGATNWITIAGFSVQPSEFAKPVLIIFLSVMFDKFYSIIKSNDISRFKIFLLILAMYFPIPIFTALQTDMGGFVIMSGIFTFMFFNSPIKKVDKLIIIGTLVGVLSLISLIVFALQGYLLNGAQLERFSFFNPCSRYENEGYQICNGFIALNEGGLTGVGIGDSTQKYSYIPHPHTDSIFAIIGEEYGVLVSSFIYFGYIFILYHILKVASKTKNKQNYYICLGIASYIFMHVAINLGGLLGIMPLTGVPLPFLSYGGSFAITLICSLAVIQKIHIENSKKKKVKH